MKKLNLTLLLMFLAFCGHAQISAISGPHIVCPGSTITLTDSTSGGTWSSSSVTFVTIGATTGIATGVSFGVANITYTVGASYVTYPVTVTAAPAPVTGPSTICVGSTAAETDGVAGGLWSSGAPAVAGIGSVSGIVSGIATGVAMITYSLGTGCAVTKVVTVNPLPAALPGSTSICAGATETITCLSSGGAWSSSATTVATIDPVTGVVTGHAAGSTTISYTLSAGCFSSMSIAVEPLPATFVVTGGGHYCPGGAGVPVGLSGSVTGIMYQLYQGTAPMGAAIAGTGTAISFGNQTVAGTYKVVANNLITGCTAQMTDSVMVSITGITIATVSGGGTYCAGSASPGVHITLSSSDTGVYYQLYLGGVPVGSPLAGTGSALDFGIHTSAGTYTIVGTDGTTACSATMLGSAVVAISPAPAAFTVTGGGSYCSGGPGVHIGLVSSQTGVNYQLYMGGTVVGPTLAGSAAALDFGLYGTSGTYFVIATSAVTGCSDTMLGTVTIGVHALPAVYHVTGGGSYCAGGAGVSVGLDGSDLGISYSLMNGSTLISTAAGTGLPISFGLETVAGTYTVVATDVATGCTNIMSGTATVLVVPLPVPSPAVTISLSAGDTVCAGSSATFSAVSVGGGTAPTYQWYVNGTAVIGATSATYTYVPMMGDIVSVHMMSSSPCALPATVSASLTMTVLPAITPAIVLSATPGTSVCPGTTVLYATTDTGGGLTPTFSWTVNSIVVPGATGSTYSYTPLSGDVVAVAMASDYLCRTASTATNSVTMAVGIPTVTATEAVAGCGGLENLFASGASTYSWSPSTGLSCTTCATTTITPFATTTYTVTGTDAYGCTNTATVAADANRISGHITYSGGTSADTFKVWLIQFNPTDSVISAVDSTASCLDGGIPYFEFMDGAAGNYMVKAKLNTSVAGASGYVPTYSLSTPHWDSAATISHATGADTMHINMVYGTVPSGPGFIGGYVVSGAGRGTSGDAPAPGMLIYLKDSIGNTLTYTYTDTDGAYGFTNLNYGTYFIYPETFKYYTTPSSVVTLSPGADSSANVNFKQHTSSGVITPYNAAKVSTMAPAGYTVQVYPNPAGNTLFLNWQQIQTGQNMQVSIKDLAGREMYTASLGAKTGSHTAQLDISTLADGIYLITLSSNEINYIGKLVIQR